MVNALCELDLRWVSSKVIESEMMTNAIWSRPKRKNMLLFAFLIATLLFIVVAPFSNDLYNTLNQRAFLDLLLQGNPFTYAPHVRLVFHRSTWLLDWPYPPLTILLDLPAWLAYRLVRSEELYQFFFKLPFFLAAVLTQVLIARTVKGNADEDKPFAAWQFYLLNPAVLLLTTLAGGFDIVTGLLILLSYLFFAGRRPFVSGTTLGLAAALRMYPIILLPLFLVALWRQSSSLKTIFGFLLFSLGPLIASFLPFFVADRDGLARTLGIRQLVYGPFATFNVADTVFQGVRFNSEVPAGLSQLMNFFSNPNFFWMLTVLNLIALYFYVVRSKVSLLDGILLTLLVFFLFYPKVHGLYTISLLPLAYISPYRLARWVWAPGALWMLLANGAFGATGILYFAAPFLGTWNPVVSPENFALVTALLASCQAVIIVAALVEILTQGKRATQVTCSFEPASSVS